MALACTVAGAPAPRAPGPVVVLVHGRGQLGQDAEALRREWRRDLNLSLRRLGADTLADADVRLAWYADVLDPESDSGCAVTSDSASLGIGAFARVLLGTITSGMPEQESRGARGIIGDLLYVVDPWKRCAAGRRVAKVIEGAVDEGRPVVVVAYSLGSVVSYDYLSSRSGQAELRFVTVGSPLGVPELRELVLPDVGQIGRPPGVASWVNVYDSEDVFSAPIGRSDAGIEDRRAESGNADNAHDVGHYLRDRVTAEAIAQALCAGTRERERGAYCRGH
jgi:hypothetical protein